MTLIKECHKTIKNVYTLSFLELQTREPDSTTYPMKTYQYFEPESETEIFRVETTSRPTLASADHRQRSADDYRSYLSRN